jgi:hypothetical protein
MEALKLANHVRLERVKLKRRVSDGEVSVMAALTDPLAATALVFDVLTWQQRWGDKRATRALTSAGINGQSRCGRLTPRQLRALNAVISRQGSPSGN